MDTASKPYDFRFGGSVVACEGIAQISIKSFYSIILIGETITITNSSISFTLDKSQVIDVGNYGQVDTITKSKNVIGRGVVGGMVFGPVGAVVGGISGVGGKKKQEHHFFWYLCFRTLSGEVCRRP